MTIAPREANQLRLTLGEPQVLRLPPEVENAAIHALALLLLEIAAAQDRGRENQSELNGEDHIGASAKEGDCLHSTVNGDAANQERGESQTPV